MTQYRLMFTCTPQLVEFYLAALENNALSLSWYETVQPDLWGIEALFANQPNLAEITMRLALIAAQHNVPTPGLTYEKVDETNWLEQVWQNFPPQKAGRYYIYGSHYKNKVPSDLIGIEMNAATAFGSGEHPTTQGCLQALDKLATNKVFSKALDMGCGSGILAIAIAKTWNCPVLAVDNDAEAVRVTTQNSTLNQCTAWITPLLSEGFAETLITTQGPYPLIVANILAKPLCSMVLAMAKNLDSKGIVILSGLLSWQVPEVLDAYQKSEFRQIQTYGIDNWDTLILELTT